jgi:hypothetical protein
MGSFAICAHHQILSACDHNKEDEMCKACNMYMREEKCIQMGKPEGKRQC